MPEPIAPPCAACGGTRFHLRFEKQGYRFVGCDGCTLMRLDPLRLHDDLGGHLLHPRLEVGQRTRGGGGVQLRHLFLVVVGVPAPQLILLLRREGLPPRRPVVQFLPDFIRDHGCLHRPEKANLPVL